MKSFPRIHQETSDLYLIFLMILNRRKKKVGKQSKISFICQGYSEKHAKIG
jgi:hypothetical protein